MAYWLMKSNPQFFGIDDLQRLETDSWDGVRNYRARNFMRDEMQVGDKVFFYHSSAKPSGVAGIMMVSKAGYPDPCQFHPEHRHYDPIATEDEPRWYMSLLSKHLLIFYHCQPLNFYPHLRIHY